MESFEQKSNQFKYPILEKEHGEFERVGKLFNMTTPDLLFAAEGGTMVLLDPSIWDQLENTDSKDIEAGQWDKVDALSRQADREWRGYKDDLDAGRSISAPIIYKHAEGYHLVSGNTRLMVCRAAGIMPKVLLFEVK